jgi:MerR family copper efflux transcriptional regulator
MKIGELARQTGVAIDTVRYYERQGLLPPPARMESGYRSYALDDVHRLRFIRRAKDLGFTLEEISGLLELSSRRHEDMAELKQAAKVRLERIDERIAELQRVRAGLEQLVRHCPGHGELGACPILNALTGD